MDFGLNLNFNAHIRHSVLIRGRTAIQTVELERQEFKSKHHHLLTSDLCNLRCHALKNKDHISPTLQVYLEEEIMPSASGTQWMIAKHELLL